MLTLNGLYIAVITPFKSGKIDEAGFKKNIDFLIENGAAGIVPCGTTGESATLSWAEHQHVVDIAVKQSGGRCQVIAGAGSNNTIEAVEAAKHAKEAGADAALVITPYYNKPTQEGLYKHFEKVAKESDIPLVLYNVPGRTGVNLLPQTVEKLCKFENIVGIKEASGNITQICEIKKRCGDRIAVISGDDAMTLPILSIGGVGVISVVGNIVPKEMSEMIRLWFDGNIEASRTLHYKLLDLCNAMFYETNPAPVKTAMNLLGMSAGELRLPMVTMQEESTKKLISVLEKIGLDVKS